MGRPSGLVDGYQALASFLGHSVLLFVALNLLFSAALSIGQAYVEHRGRSAATERALKAVYPGMSLREIDELLRETRHRPHVYEPFTVFKERPFSGKYVNVHEAGFRLSKRQGPWPPDPSNLNVFVFGGSTTFGYGVADDQTIASFLGEQLSPVHVAKESRVYNFGRGSYYSTQERILFEKLLTEGAIPDMAIFIDGLNDSSAREPVYTQRMWEIFDAYEGGSTVFLWRWLRLLPVGQTAINVRRRAPLRAATADGTPLEPTRVAKVIDRYLGNKTLIEQAARHYGVRVVFVWQPIPVYKYDLAHHVFWRYGSGASPSPTAYERMARLVEERDLGQDFLYCVDMQEGLKEPLYVDAIHYSGRMHERIAALIVRLMLERGLLPKT